MIRRELDIFILLLLSNLVAGETYEGLLMGMQGCSDFDNKALNSDNLGLQVTEDGESMQITGYIEITGEIDDDFNVQLKVTKETEAGNQAMFSATANVCASLKDDSAPWYSVVQAMNITGCPIKVGQYPLDNVFLNMDFAKEVLNHDNCGDYIVKFEIMRDMNEMFSCHNLGMSIIEHDDEE